MPIFDFISEAVLAKDVTVFLLLYTNDTIDFNIWDEWVYEGRDARSKMDAQRFASFGDERVLVTFSSIIGQIEEDTVPCLTTVRYAQVDQAGKELSSLENRQTWALRRLDGIWRFVHEHVLMPVNGEAISLVRYATC